MCKVYLAFEALVMGWRCAATHTYFARQLFLPLSAPPISVVDVPRRSLAQPGFVYQ